MGLRRVWGFIGLLGDILGGRRHLIVKNFEKYRQDNNPAVLFKIYTNFIQRLFVPGNAGFR